MAEVSPQGMTSEEIEELDSEQLPDREQMSLVNANVAAPIDAAVAAQILTDDSTATAETGPDAPISQDAGDEDS